MLDRRDADGSVCCSRAGDRVVLTRREMIGSVCAASALSGLPMGAGFAASKGIPAACIVESSLVGSNTMAAGFRAGRAPVHCFFGDPGGVWMHRLEPMLRDRPVPIAGYTSGPSLFCLQYLARDYGLRLTTVCDDISRSDTFAGRQPTTTELIDTHQRDHGRPMTWLLAPQRG